MKPYRIAIIGAGAVGTTLAVALHHKGYRIVGVASRTQESAKKCSALVNCPLYSEHPAEVAKTANVIFISTPDHAIKTVCDQIAREGGFKQGDIVIHLSGALSSDILGSAKIKGAHTLALHPVQTFPKGQISPEVLSGCYFSLEGDKEALEFGRELVEDLGGKPLIISSEVKPLYHAALSVASNYLVTVVDVAVQMLEKTGIKKKEALKMVMPLIETTVRNLRQVGLPEALTGPVKRGDLQTVEKHLRVIQEFTPEFLCIYKKLGQLTVELAKQAGTLDEEKSARLRELFTL